VKFHVDIILLLEVRGN